MPRTTVSCRSVILVLGCLLLAACGGNTIDTSGLKPVPPASMFVEHLAPFCREDTPDKFTAGYFGSSPLDTTIYFYIICHRGDTVFRDQWPGKWLLSPHSQGDAATQVAQAHQTLHELVEGKLAPPKDSAATAVASRQPVFGYRLQGHRDTLVYFSQEAGRVAALLPQ